MATSGDAPSHDGFFRPKTVLLSPSFQSLLRVEGGQTTAHGFQIELDHWTSSWLFVSPAHHEKYQDQQAKKRHHLGFSDPCNQMAGHKTLENLVLYEISAC